MGKVDSSKNGGGQRPRKAVKFEVVAMLVVLKPEAAALQYTLLLSPSHSANPAVVQAAVE